MQPFFKDTLDILQKLHNIALQTFQDLPQEALDWIPAKGINSFNVLVTHLTSAERYWIGDVAGGDPSGRIREEEFLAQGQNQNMLTLKLSDSLAYANGVFEGLTLQDLEQPRTSTMTEYEVTVGWALMHALEHSAIHVGHMQILRQWWDQEQGN